MKTKSRRIRVLLTIVGVALLCPALGQSAVTNAAPERIGVYDSRTLAYAEFCTDAHQRKLNEQVKAAREAKAAGQSERLKELETALKQEQERNHLQVFSTAPVDDVLTAMKDRVVAVQKETGTSRMVSKWDDKTLAANQGAEQVDVTDLLLQEFKLTDKQKKVIADLRKQKPLPLEQARELLRDGKL
jgi:hypothetical protein